MSVGMVLDSQQIIKVHSFPRLLPEVVNHYFVAIVTTVTNSKPNTSTARVMCIRILKVPLIITVIQIYMYARQIFYFVQCFVLTFRPS